MRTTMLGWWPALAVIPVGLVGGRDGPMAALLAVGVTSGLLGLLGVMGYARHRRRLAGDPRVAWMLAVDELRQAFENSDDRCLRLAAAYAAGGDPGHRSTGCDVDAILAEARDLRMVVQGFVQDASERVRTAPPIGRIADDSLRRSALRVSSGDRAHLAEAARRLRALDARLATCREGRSGQVLALSRFTRNR